MIRIQNTKPAFTARVWAAFFACALLVMGCPDPNGSDNGPGTGQPKDADAQLVNAVYGGLNPGGAWVTVSFQTDGKVVCAFSADNSTNKWDYTYANKDGTISRSDGQTWTPGAFTISDDGGALTFTNFGGHGVEKIFSRLRKSDLAVSSSPAGLAALLTASMEGSVWGGSTPQSENTGWLSLAFKAGGKIICAFSADNSTNEWDYTYNNDRTGTITTGGGWPGPGAFTVSEDGNTLTFSNYGGLNPGGAWVTVSFQTDGKVVCAFSADNTTNKWDYTYANKNGTISRSDGQTWTPGAFTISDDGGTLTFTNFGGHGAEKIFSRLRKSDLAVSSSPAGLAALPANLEGSVWGGSTPQAENTGWLSLAFKAGGKIICAFSADNSTNEWDYTYNNDRTGTITTGGGWPGPGAFTVSEDGNTLTFSNYGGHGSAKTFTRYHQAENAAP